MCEKYNSLEAIDMIIKIKINSEILEQTTDEKRKDMIKLLNKYGIWGIDVISFLNKMALICGEEGDAV